MSVAAQGNEPTRKSENWTKMKEFDGEEKSIGTAEVRQSSKIESIGAIPATLLLGL